MKEMLRPSSSIDCLFESNSVPLTFFGFFGKVLGKYSIIVSKKIGGAPFVCLGF